MKQFLYFIFFVCIINKTYAQGNSDTPNVLFIAIDDLKSTLGCYGDSYAKTPQIDALAAKGTVFLNNHAQWSVCGPSRSSLLTGKRPDYTKVWNLSTLIRTENPNVITLPQYFKSKNYNVVGGGKIFDTRSVDNNLDTQSWSTSFKKPTQLNYPAEYGKPVLGHYQTNTIKDEFTRIENILEENRTDDENNYKPIYEIGADDQGNSIPDNAYNDGALADYAIEQIENFENDTDTPFFLAVGFKNPHLPFSCPKKYFDLYDKTSAPLANYSARGTDIPALALAGSGELVSYHSYDLDITRESDNSYTISEEDQKTIIHAYYASVSYIDAQIGRIVDRINENSNLANNTIIVIWSDHGFHLGDHSMWGKHSNMESATKSPLIIYNPFNPSSNTTNQPTELLDLYPTICDLTNQQIPNDMDGISLKPLMENPDTSIKDFAISQFKSSSRYGYSFKNDRYRYTVWLNNDKKATDNPTTDDYYEQELYDYQSDPNETTNYFNNPLYSTIQTNIVNKAQEYFNNGGGINSGNSSEYNIITNGDFQDTDNYLNNWSFNTSGNAFASIGNAEGESFKGNNGAKIIVTTQGTNFNNVRLQNEKYTDDLTNKTININVKAKGTVGNEQFKVRIYHNTNNINEYPTSETFNLKTDEYELYSYEFEVPDNTSELRVDLLMGTTTGTYLFDDITTTVSNTPTLSNKNVNYLKHIGVYPIPAKNHINIDVKDQIKHINIYNVFGKLTLSKSKIINNKIDISSLTNGIYVLLINFADGSLGTTKLIIAK